MQAEYLTFSKDKYINKKRIMQYSYLILLFFVQLPKLSDMHVSIDSIELSEQWKNRSNPLFVKIVFFQNQCGMV